MSAHDVDILRNAPGRTPGSAEGERTPGGGGEQEPGRTPGSAEGEPITREEKERYADEAPGEE